MFGCLVCIQGYNYVYPKLSLSEDECGPAFFFDEFTIKHKLKVCVLFPLFKFRNHSL